MIHAKNLLQQETKNLATLSLMRLDEIFEKSMELGTAQGYNVARQTIALQMELFHVEDKESKVVEITRNWTWNKIEKSGTE